MNEKLDNDCIVTLLGEANILLRLYEETGYNPKAVFLSNRDYDPGVVALVAVDQLQRQRGAVVTRVSYKKTSSEAHVFLQGFVPEVGISCSGQDVEFVIPVNSKQRENALLVYAFCMSAEVNMRRYNSGCLNFNERDTNHSKQNLEKYLIQ